MTWKDLWEADMGVVMTEYFFKDDVDGTKYGHFALRNKKLGSIVLVVFH